MGKIIKAKCIRDCWDGDLQYINEYDTKMSGMLYIQGQVYDLDENSPVLQWFVDPVSEKRLREPLPPIRYKEGEEENKSAVDKLIEANAQLMETVKQLLAEKHSKGDEALEKMGLSDKRGPGRPTKQEG